MNKLELNYDNFMEEFTAILHRRVTVSESNKCVTARTRGRGRRELKSGNQYCTATRRTVGAAADLYGNRADHYPERGSRLAGGESVAGGQ